MSQNQLALNFSGRPAKPPEKRIVVFDIETQKSAQDVGGWGNKQLMRVAVAVTFDSIENKFKVFLEKDVPELLSLLKMADLVIGYNSKNFDYAVLAGYTDEPLEKTLPSLDILEEVEKAIGFRVKLDNIASATLGVGKTADGLQSLQWFKEGKLDLIADYCTQDVKVTRDVYLYGLEQNHLFYTGRGRAGEKKKIPVNFRK